LSFYNPSSPYVPSNPIPPSYNPSSPVSPFYNPTPSPPTPIYIPFYPKGPTPIIPYQSKYPKVSIIPTEPKKLYSHPRLITKKIFSLNIPVFIRRFGKWKSLGIYPSSKIALNVGKEYTLKTLGRSFYIGGKQPKSLLPQFRTKKEKNIGQIFIQKTKYPGGSTLGTLGEKREIQFFRGLKGGKKRK